MVWPFKKKKEERSLNNSWPGFGAGRNVDTISYLNPLGAENLSTVMACVSAISTALASLSNYVYRVDGKDRLEAPEHALALLIRSGPNQWQSWPDLIEFWTAQVLLYGNGLLEIVADNKGEVAELKPIPWPYVSVQLLPNGKLVYDLYDQSTLYGKATQGRRRRLLSDEVIHLKDRSDDGLLGRSRLQRSMATVKAAQDINQASHSIFEQGLFPSGVIESQRDLGKEARQLLMEAFNQRNQGPGRAGRIMLLDEGFTWKQLSMTPEDSELLNSRKFSVEEICRIYQVPPPLIQDYSHNTFTNSEQAGRWFAQFCLLPWVRKIESEFSRSLFNGTPYALELDMSNFDRGDSATRWAAHKIAVDAGILSTDEIREIEGWNPQTAQANKINEQTNSAAKL